MRCVDPNQKKNNLSITFQRQAHEMHGPRLKQKPRQAHEMHGSRLKQRHNFNHSIKTAAICLSNAASLKSTEFHIEADAPELQLELDVSFRTSKPPSL